MRKVVLLVTVFLVVGVSAQAQDPRVEIFGGYSYASFDGDGFPTLLSDRVNANGWGSSLSVNLSSRFGITFDVANQFGSGSVFLTFAPTTMPDFRSFQFLVGPRIFWRAPDLTWFVHVLVGGVRNRVSSFTSLITRLTIPTEVMMPAQSETDFAFATGGGLDVRLSPLFALRAFQVDYIPVEQGIFSDPFVKGHILVKTGIVLRF